MSPRRLGIWQATAGGPDPAWSFSSCFLLLAASFSFVVAQHILRIVRQEVVVLLGRRDDHGGTVSQDHSKGIRIGFRKESGTRSLPNSGLIDVTRVSAGWCPESSDHEERKKRGGTIIATYAVSTKEHGTAAPK